MLDSRARLDGWTGFLTWSLAGGLISFAWVTGFSIGLFVLPFALAAVLFAALRARTGAESFGLLLGFGATCLIVATINWDYNPCPENGVLTALTPGERAVSCGGLNPAPWLMIGISLAATGIIGFWLTSSRPRGLPRGGTGTPRVRDGGRDGR